jgi:CubicO group peptidase (beta-lactamase class C family)
MQIFLQFLLNDMHLESGQQYLTNDLLQSFLSHQLSSHLGTSPLSRSLPKTKGDGLSYGLAIHLQDGGLLTEPDTYDYLYWSGFSGSGFWFNADRTMGGIFVSQLFNSDQFLLPDIAENIRH